MADAVPPPNFDRLTVSSVSGYVLCTECGSDVGGALCRRNNHPPRPDRCPHPEGASYPDWKASPTVDVLLYGRASPWWMKPVSAFLLALFTLAAAALSVAACLLARWWFGLALCVFLGGCAVGYPLRDDGTADTGDAIIGISTGTANAAGAGLLSLGGLLSGNPLLVGLAALVSNQMGKRAGWDERESAAMVQAPLPDAKGGRA